MKILLVQSCQFGGRRVFIEEFRFGYVDFQSVYRICKLRVKLKVLIKFIYGLEL